MEGRPGLRLPHPSEATCLTARCASVIEARWSIIPDKSEFAKAMRAKGCRRISSAGPGLPLLPKKKPG